MGFPEWKDRLPEDEAMIVRDNSEVIGDGTHEKDCFWRGYRTRGGKFYVGLCDSLDIWETDEQTMLNHCVKDTRSYVEAERMRAKDNALAVIALSPTIRMWLEANDPKALQQVLDALDT